MKSKIQEVLFKNNFISTIIICQIIFIVALSMSAKADHYTSTINIRNHNNDLITVMLDGIQYPNAMNEFHLSGISPGRHYIKVFTRENHGYNYSKFNHLLFNGEIMLRSGEEIFAVIDGFNQLHIKYECRSAPVSRLVVHPNNLSTIASPCNFQINESYIAPIVNTYSPYAMNENTFLQLKHSISDKWFDSSKLEVAQMAMKNNYFTSAQIASIMNLFDFESTKLEFAKMAYNHVVDQQNYWMVNDVFSFSSSISNLQEFIGY